MSDESPAPTPTAAATAAEAEKSQPAEQAGGGWGGWGLSIFSEISRNVRAPNPFRLHTPRVWILVY